MRAPLREADAVINLCGAAHPREEHIATKRLVYIESNFSVQLGRHIDTGQVEDLTMLVERSYSPQTLRADNAGAEHEKR
jgi:hypothetical protein